VADERTIERTLRIEALPEVVFGFLTDPDQMPQWMGIGAELDPRPGGIFRCAMVRRGIFACGEFVEVEWPHRIVFTWGWQGSDRLVPPGSTRVEFTLRRDRDGTVLTLRHSGLPSGHESFHEFGWRRYLDRLAVVSSGRDPGPDEWDDAAQRAAAATLPPAI
jgi:uncharacterized protein YndB with AHSA1/START domain